MASSFQPSVAITQLPLSAFVGPQLLPILKFAFVYGSDAQSAIFITNEDEVYAVGTNSYGRLGVGDEKPRTDPGKVVALSGKKISTISAGVDHVLAITSDGALYVWGFNGDGQLGNDTQATHMCTPQLNEVLEGRRVTKIACGRYHSQALTDKGEVFAWGHNAHGQIGCGTTVSQVKPVLVHNLPSVGTVTGIACCNHSSFALTAAGEIYSWGENHVGQLGIVTKESQTSPRRVGADLGLNFKSIACGQFHIIALTDKRKVYGWGSNNNGQVKSHGPGNIFIPTYVDLGCDISVQEIGALLFCHLSAAMTTTGEVLVWGETRHWNLFSARTTGFQSLHDAFQALAKVPVTLKPLKSDDVDDSVRAQLELHFDNEELSDVHFVIGEKKIHGHVSILRIRSPYLRSMLSSNWCKDNREVEIQGHPYNAFRAYIQYLYTEELEVDAADVMDLLRLADEFCENKLKKLCERLILNIINTDNAFSIYEAAKKLSAKELEDECFTFLVTNLTVATTTEAFKRMDPLVSHEFFQLAGHHGAYKH